MKKSYIKYLCAVLLFGTNGIVASNIHLSSYQIVLLRTLLGSAVLLAVFLLSRRRFSFTKHKKDLVFIGVSGVAMGASWMLLYEGYAQIGVSIASLLYYTGPVIVMVLSPLIFAEKLTAAKLTGFAAVLCGIVLVNGVGAESVNLWGICCGILSAVTYAVMVITNKKSKSVLGMENTLLQLVFAFFTVALFVAVKGGYAMSIGASEWLWILLLGVVNTGFGCYLFFSSIGSLPVQSVAVCGYIEPLAAVIFSVLLLGEKMEPLQALGAVLIIGGAVTAELWRTGKKKTD